MNRSKENKQMYQNDCFAAPLTNSEAPASTRFELDDAELQKVVGSGGAPIGVAPIGGFGSGGPGNSDGCDCSGAPSGWDDGYYPGNYGYPGDYGYPGIFGGYGYGYGNAFPNRGGFLPLLRGLSGL